MITPAGSFRVFLDPRPVDFRKGMDGLAGYVAAHLDRDPFDEAIYVFRSRRADRLKMIVWDGTGLMLIMKRLNSKRFVWPKANAGRITLTKMQFGALFEGIDWQDITASETRKPSII